MTADRATAIIDRLTGLFPIRRQSTPLEISFEQLTEAVKVAEDCGIVEVEELLSVGDEESLVHPSNLISTWLSEKQMLVVSKVTPLGNGTIRLEQLILTIKPVG